VVRPLVASVVFLVLVHLHIRHVLVVHVLLVLVRPLGAFLNHVVALVALVALVHHNFRLHIRLVHSDLHHIHLFQVLVVRVALVVQVALDFLLLLLLFFRCLFLLPLTS
jgi:uncharacterized RDD family membrane protein YckC